QGLAMADELLDCFYVAEFHRIQGELLRPDDAAAEACFRTALDIAGRQQARTLVLRAALSLARHLVRPGERAGARTALAAPCEWFRNEYPTTHVIEARTLFAELT